MPKLIKQFLVSLLLSQAIAVASLAQTRGLQLNQLTAMREAADAQVSPDGKQIAFVMSETAPDRSRTLRRLWLVSVQGGEVRRLTNDDASESTPRWSPDGKWIAFVSNRDKQSGLWVAAATGGAPKLVTHLFRSNFYLTHEGESFAWSPDAKRIAFVSSNEVIEVAARVAPAATTQPAAAETPANTALNGIPEQLRRPLTRAEIDKLPPEVREMILRAQGQAIANAGAATVTVAPVEATPPVNEFLSEKAEDPRVVTRLQYKSRTSFSDALSSHIFVAEVETGQVQQLTSGNYNEHSINWSPKGDEIAFVSNREANADKVNNTDIYAVNVASRETRQLTKTPGCEWMPVFSPDGKDIAYTATKRAITTIDSVAEDNHLFVITAASVTAGQGTDARELNKDQDRRVGSFKWSHDGAFVLFTAGDHGKTMLYQANRLSGPRQLLDYNGQMSSFSVGKDGTLAMTISDPTHPSEVYATRTAGKFEPITKLNEKWLGTFTPVAPREIKFTNDGLEIQGWLYAPANLDESKKYPLVLSIHGGPHGMSGLAFNTNAQLWAGQGMATLLVNPRGSSGYGQKFSDGCVNDWGGGDYRDLMKGVDEALARFKFLDADRLGVTGGSYGGYMTNWVVTQTNRFKAAVTAASLSNLISFYSTSLYQDLIHAEFNGFPWDNYELLWER
ncbi:MAG: S9 family peptidase [Acidobacteria bacterium]|nr:S9 family peptidase [Acidobacteriota bacterium]